MESTYKFGLKDFFVILLSIVLVVVVILFFQQRKENNLMVNQLNSEKDSIKTELTKMVVNYDSLKTTNEEVNQHLMLTQNEIKNLLVQIEQVKKTSYAEVSGYKDKVNTLRGIMKDLYNQIDSLNERNKILYAENIQVKQKYSTEKTKNDKLVK